MREEREGDEVKRGKEMREEREGDEGREGRR